MLYYYMLPDGITPKMEKQIKEYFDDVEIQQIIIDVLFKHKDEAVNLEEKYLGLALPFEIDLGLNHDYDAEEVGLTVEEVKELIEQGLVSSYDR